MDMKPSSCPCSLFSTPNDVVAALKSEEKAKILLEWIQGDEIQYNITGFQKRALSTQTLCKNQTPGFAYDQPCPNRLASAYCILNAIRDACREFLETGTKTGSDSWNESPEKKATSTNPFSLSDEHAFPSLAPPSKASLDQKTNILQPKRKVKTTKLSSEPNTGNTKPLETVVTKKETVPSKRRIRPARIKTTEISQGAWGVEVSVPEGVHTFQADTMERAMTSKHISQKTGLKKDPMQRFMSTNDTYIDSAKVLNRLPVERLKGNDVDPILLAWTVEAYSTIVKSNLVPSLALELQLLIRLLSLNDNEKQKNSSVSNASDSLHELFVDEYACRKFASLVLERLKYVILNLDYNIAASLLKMDSFTQLLPSLTEELQHRLEGYRAKIIYDADSNVVSGKSTLLSLPFQENRDSRHNFRSQKLSAIYNNREKCRDSFLFQLRAFQQMRGTVLNPAQGQRSLEVIKKASVEVIENTLSTNIPWFAEFFVDLLLQIGLVQVQETDDDILKNVRDKDKLQKLHSRFTSKASQKNKSTNRLVLREIEDDSLGPDQFFTGNQEFFFIFMKHVDSYVFTIHLQQRLVDVILSYSRSADTKHLEQRISELQMLSKFLGFIHFSPNYNLPEESSGPSREPLVPLHSIVQDAFNEGKMLLIIPWVLNFMRMIQWDKISIKSKYYQDVFCLLRTIQKHILRQIFDSKGYQTNLQLLEFQIDIFFSETVGLSHIEKLEIYDLPLEMKQNDSLDMVPFGFTKEFIASSSPHIDDLCKLIAEICTNGRVSQSSGASKKLKPYVLSTRTAHNSDSSLLSPFDPLEQGKLDFIYMKVSSLTVTNNIHDQLVDAFFHQHKHLQQLCEFVVDFGIQHVLSKRMKDTVLPSTSWIFNTYMAHESIPNPIELEWYLRVRQNLEQKTFFQVQSQSKIILQNYIEGAMSKLIPPDVDEKVKDVCVELTLQHAYRKAESFNAGIVRKEVKNLLDKEIDTTLTRASTPLNVENEIITSILKTISGCKMVLIDIANISTEKPASSETVLDFISSLSEITSRLRDFIRTSEPIISNKSLAIEINDLLPFLKKSIATCFEIKDSQVPVLVLTMIELALLFVSTGGHMVSGDSIGLFLSQPRCLSFVLKLSQLTDVEILVRRCVDTHLIRPRDLESGLNRVLDQFNLSASEAEICMRLLDY